ncbi:hypothetical protein CRE_23149 [Caenorhabditis remanei]|uniref:DUF7154 domain-containing protein n=1 Tax=Caenorhabditis remanei TaxID=31234 RepID=E3NFW9_CAERE|nr:hypothetical protein CRE_23149 [Caenorhabditis remanei]
MYCENGSSVLTFDDTGLGKMYNSPIATGECDPTTRQVTMLIQDPSENEFTYTQLLGTCLVKEKCECTAIALDSLNIGGFIDSTSPFYSQMMSSDSKLPFISVSGCTTSMICASGYSLLLFDDTGLGKVFETLSASGQCIAKTNKWKVDTGSRVRLTTFNQMYGICVVNDSETPPAVSTSTTIPTTTTVDTNCTPSTLTTLAYAYSNDWDAQDFLNFWNVEHSFQSYNPQNLDKSWIKYANIRFDTVNEDSIQYHNTYDELDLSIKDHLPDPSLGFNTTATGSDILKIIEKFADNTQAPLCGARMIIFVKRYPNEVNIDRLVGKLREHHISLHIYVTDTPKGGLHSETLYNLASRTNGMCIFYNEAGYDFRWSRSQKLFYAVNPKVSGRGSVQLPVPQKESMAGSEFHLVVEDGPRKFFENVKLSWIYSSWSETMVEAIQMYSTNYGVIMLWKGDSLSNLSMQYDYSDEKVRTVQVRLYDYS